MTLARLTSARPVAVAVLSLALASPVALPQPPSNGAAVPLSASTVISSAALLHDAAILREAYEQLHPGLYRYNTKAEMDARFDDLNAQFAHDQTLQEAYLALSRFTAAIRCGHTYPNFFNQGKAVSAALFEAQPRLPFYFVWLDRTLVVTRDLTPGHTLPRGTQITAINGVPSAEILKRLLAVARADGSNDAKRIAYLGLLGDSRYEAFDIYLPMFVPLQSSVTLSVRRPGDPQASTITVPTLTFAQRTALLPKQATGDDQPLFTWSALPSGAAVLRMPTWAVYNSKWDWKGWLNARLDELATANAPALIIDLRGNEGGNDVGDEILKRIVPAQVSVSPMRRLVRYRKTPADLDPFLDTWDPSFKDWKADAVELPQPWPTAPPVPFFSLDPIDAPLRVIQPEGKPYRGRVFVLIDANNSSATFQFAQIIQANHLGTLVGQPTGGSLRGINGGSFFFLRLPGSHLEVDLPLVGTFPPTPQPDSGLSPDLPVQPTAADIAAGRDPVLSAASSRVVH